MQIQNHLIVSTIGGIGVYLMCDSFKAGIVSFLAGVLIDLDHIPDYLFFKKGNLNLKDFFSDYLNIKLSRYYLIFHSYELIFILFSLYIFVGKDPILIGLIVGITIHILLDHLTNTKNPFSYFFIYRALKKFKREELL